ncbi:serine/threonine protein kinase [Bacillus toyonensis]|uniref:formylglycine-generating enzyme family protein n=1 Tax=Bacillus toyonensis TaxID=155322 RepID=UPI000BF5A76E|nr:SUMF1/EgtB/PvdO family nonheme iron enzyme [Bacillus toyonensis]PGE16326.1 serine/threonine protein kinase [Bacillus toyonensis]
MEKMIKWIKITSGSAFVGSSMHDVEEAYNYWKDNLLDPNYKKDFKKWLLKEYPSYEQHIDDFYISDSLITNELFKLFCDETNHEYPESLWNEELGGGGDYPVWGVTIEEVCAFCQWFTNKVGYKVSLPSEPQWEYAARGSTTNQYPWGNLFDPNKCNSFESEIGKTTPVRHYENGRSYFGLYDMGGNVEEWVDTKYNKYTGGTFIQDDLTETLGESYYVLKGGSFIRGGDMCRVARRHGRHPDPLYRFTGFRIVRN